MAEVFSGFVIGYALALAAGPAGAIALVRSNTHTGFAQRVAPPGTNIIALSVVVHFTGIIVFTGLGMVLGMVLAGLNARGSHAGLGSPNVPYTVIVALVAVILVAPAFAVPRLRALAIAGAVILVASFGWAMPWLAKLG
jgi:hypothetical protein